MRKVSIITSCYNAEKYILKTYNSLNMQSYANWEWIVTDDCSTDSSITILNKLAKEDFRVKVFKNTHKQGIASTKNNCLDKAKGDYISFLNYGDLWKSNKLEKQIFFMTQNLCLFSYHAYDITNSKDHLIKTIFPRSTTHISNFLKLNPIAASTVIIRASLIQKNGIHFKEHLEKTQDSLFWYETLQCCQTAKGLIDVLSSCQMTNDKALSLDKKKMALTQWNLYRHEFNLSLIQSSYYFFYYTFYEIKKCLL